MAATLAPRLRGDTAPYWEWRATDKRDRFLAFAFAAADLLVEATPDGIITFAAGAFLQRLGAEAARFLGLHASALVAPSDRSTFAGALATVSLHGRIAPVLIRLSDPGASTACLSAMLVPENPPRLCLTLGPAPALPPEKSPVRGSLGKGTRALSRAATRRLEAASLRSATPALGFVEMAGWPELAAEMSDADQQALREGVTESLSAGGLEAPCSEVAEGRFGLVLDNGLALEAVVDRLRRLVQDSPARGRTRVAASRLPLHAGRLAPSQAARALRFALSNFARNGAITASHAGEAEGGLAAVIEHAEHRTRAMQQAIAGRRFRLLFQPIVTLATRSVHHYEALLRPVATPGNPVQSPQEFVNFAEAVGLAEALDTAVLEQACRVLDRAGGPPVAINISGLSLQSPSFRTHVLNLLHKRPHVRRLLFELTETAEIEDVPAAACSMTLFREAGVPMCLDDFGAGAAAFRYLRDLPLDFVKIDGGYVHSAMQGTRGRGFVVSMIDLARSVRARTVAEMVETESQAGLLHELGAELGQGWLFGRPAALPRAQG